MNTNPLPAGDVTARIARLFIYPVKSCAGVELHDATLSATGLALDRTWMVVDAHGVFVTQREMPRLALVRPQIQADTLVLHAPGMPILHLPLACEVQHTTAVTLWHESVPACDMGEAPARWFSQFLASPSDGAPAPASYRLVRYDPAHARLSNLQWTQGVQALNQFSDGYPVLVISEASLESLNDRLRAQGHRAVGIERFRPNIVLAGLQAHDEDRLDVLHIGTGAAPVRLKPCKPCPRCPIPNIDPATATSSPEVSDTLQSYRQDPRVGGAPTFGMNAIVLGGVGAVLRVGQAVSADFDFG